MFWLSLVPFVTRWLGESLAPFPTAIYGGVLLLAGFAYLILQTAIVTHQGTNSKLAAAVGMRSCGAADATDGAVITQIMHRLRAELASEPVS